MEKELPAEKLRKEVDLKLVRCKTTADLSPLEEIIGQERAVKALKFGLDIEEHGFNIYVSGYPGTGRMTAIKDYLEKVAKTKPVPSDWCYVNNFSDPYQSRAIKLPPGKGREFQKDMKNFVDETKKALVKAFESEQYAKKKETTIKSVENERDKLFSELNAKAQQEGFLIQNTPIGVLLIPVIDGKPLNDQKIVALNPKVRQEIEDRKERLASELRNAMRKLRDMERKIGEEISKLNREIALYALDHLLTDLLEKYEKMEDITSHLKEVRDDILENLSLFLGEPKAPQTPFPAPWLKELRFRNYDVNVIVDNSDLDRAPVVMEFNPTHQNLFGRIDKEAQFGALTTDFTMIHSGSLHQANGGYLVVPVEELLRNLFSYDGLKRALIDEKIVIEEAGERLGFITAKGLMPEPIPLNVKVVLVGDPIYYQQLYVLDKNFKELFKVKADFDTTMERNEENMQLYAAFICTLCQKEELKHFDSSGVAKLIEHSSRLAEDQEKLSTGFAEIADIIREANFYATSESSEYVSEKHVKEAVDEKIYRSKLIQEKIQEMIKRGTLLIDTDGKVVGQVNGLSVMSLGDFAFGAPSRVTASVGLGREGIIDIQREAKLAGPIHTKGVMILSGYLAEKYAQDKPLSLSAHLVFEQSYGMVEGDSASSTELYAMLSALSRIPVKQGIAVTGSVNQKGEVQAIGGVNEKIEGFFEVCRAKGLTGRQGVVVPASNVQNLMLKEEVVNAVRDGQFHVYPVKTIDEGIEVLTELNAGKKMPEGTYEKETINYMVSQRLKEMAEKLKEFPEFVVQKRKE